MLRVERFKERLNIKIVKKVNGSDDGVDDKSALLSDYKYDNSTSKECNDIMKGMEGVQLQVVIHFKFATFMLVILVSNNLFCIFSSTIFEFQHFSGSS